MHWFSKKLDAIVLYIPVKSWYDFDTGLGYVSVTGQVLNLPLLEETLYNMLKGSVKQCIYHVLKLIHWNVFLKQIFIDVSMDFMSYFNSLFLVECFAKYVSLFENHNNESHFVSVKPNNS